LEWDERLGAYVADKFRYDYNSGNGELVLRMPSPLHDIFALRLQEVISRELKALEEPKIHTIIQSIKIAATSDLQFGITPTKGKKSLDRSFRFSGAKHPPLVIEVTNSQKRDDLPPLAESYVEHTKGRTKTIITIDLEYIAPNKRTT